MARTLPDSGLGGGEEEPAVRVVLWGELGACARASGCNRFLPANSNMNERPPFPVVLSSLPPRAGCTTA